MWDLQSTNLSSSSCHGWLYQWRTRLNDHDNNNVCAAWFSFLAPASFNFKFDHHFFLKWCCALSQSRSPLDSVLNQFFPDLVPDRKTVYWWIINICVTHFKPTRWAQSRHLFAIQNLLENTADIHSCYTFQPSWSYLVRAAWKDRAFVSIDFLSCFLWSLDAEEVSCLLS